jgi:hypothetical protein
MTTPEIEALEQPVGAVAPRGPGRSVHPDQRRVPFPEGLKKFDGANLHLGGGRSGVEPLVEHLDSTGANSNTAFMAPNVPKLLGSRSSKSVGSTAMPGSGPRWGGVGWGVGSGAGVTLASTLMIGAGSVGCPRRCRCCRHWRAALPRSIVGSAKCPRRRSRTVRFHSATASGYVLDYPPIDAFPIHNTAETLFNRLEAKGLTWCVYCDAPSPASFTGLIHAPRLRGRFKTNFKTVADFLEDASAGRLPTYAFIEPNMWYAHNDMHPPESGLLHGIAFDEPSSLIGGEALLAQIYEGIKSRRRRTDRTTSTHCC